MQAAVGLWHLTLQADAPRDAAARPRARAPLSVSFSNRSPTDTEGSCVGTCQAAESVVQSTMPVIPKFSVMCGTEFGGENAVYEFLPSCP